MRPMRPLLLSLSVMALAACHPYSNVPVANKGGTADLPKAQALVEGASHGQMKATQVFKGPDGLVGILTEPANGGTKQIVWGSPHLEVLMPADALNKEGKGQNAKYMADQKVYMAPAELAEKVKDRGFIVGKSGPLITVFMDPNCIFCNKLYKEAAPYVKDGTVRIRYIMVGFLKQSSIPKAVAIVTAADPAKALDKDERNFDEAHEEGGAPTPKDLDQNAMQQVRDDTTLMNKAGGTGTPAILACQKGSEDPTLLSGMPQDFKGFLANLDPNNPKCK